MSENDVILATGPVVEALEALGVPYRIGGSVASSVLGVPRSTLDVDLVCTLESAQVGAFVARLTATYYVDEEMVRDAIARRASFNVIHLDTMLKVDVFIRKERPFDRAAFGRSTRGALEVSPSARLFDLSSAEDIILHKLEWFRMGGEVSERQWKDVLGVLRVQRDRLDLDYLRSWAVQLGVDDLLVAAFGEAWGPLP